MKAKQRGNRGAETGRKAQVRATISFPPDVHATLEMIAKQKKVSLAWVVREAAEQYLAEKWPLFKEQA
jgi:predicted transcriptional regulator